MKIFRNILLILFSVFVLLLVAAYIWREELIAMAIPKIEKIKVTNLSVTNNSANLGMDLVIQNKKYISYHLKSIELDIYNDTLSLLHYKNDSLLNLDREERKNFNFNFKLPIKKIMKRVKSLQNSDSTEIRIVGRAIFSTSIGDITLPINELKRVEVPNLIKVDLEEVQYDGKKGDRYLIEAKLKVTNLNAEKIEIRNITYNFFGEDLVVLHGTYKRHITVPAMGHMHVSFPMLVKIEDKFKLASRLIWNKEPINYKFMMEGEVLSIGGINQDIPIQVNTIGKVNFFDKKHKNKVKFTSLKKHHDKKMQKSK